MMKYKSVIILGSRGMLGQMVKMYFKSKEFIVHEYNERFTDQTFNQYVNDINSLEDSIVVNCVGRIKQKSEDTYDLLLTNSVLPLTLARSLKPSHLLIHPSTDCVFDGKNRGKYEINFIHNAKDTYGWSKSIGETAVLSRCNTLIVRVSIIGPDGNSCKGLLSWFLSNPDNSKLNGFTNHFWNGITSLEWCKKLHELLDSDNLVKKVKVIQLGTEETYSKYEMLILFQNVFQTNFEILPFESTESINRCLLPDKISKNLFEQLVELKTFMQVNNILSEGK